MSYNQWSVRNLDALSENYKSRFEFVKDTPFYEYCDYIYTGVINGCYIPEEHLKNIKEN